jgi:hypothetical protein
VLQYDLMGNFIKKWDGYIDAALHLGNKNIASDISKCCLGKKQTCKGFIWKLE